MKTTQTLLAAVILSTGLLSAASAQAAAASPPPPVDTLIDRGGGLIYDTGLNVTWLANANANGLMTWSQATTWAANLSYYDSVRNVTYTDWRLPQPDASCYGYNCTSSEMGHLFYNELGGVAGQSITTTHNANYDLFQNVQSHLYWSSTEYAPYTGSAWDFYFNTGSQTNYYKTSSMYALAVRPGDVTAVPVPAAAWLLWSGLLALAGMARRKAA